MATASRFGSVNIQNGQAVHFSVPYDIGADHEQTDAEFERAKETIAALGEISLPTSHEVNVAHGGYGIR